MDGIFLLPAGDGGSSAGPAAEQAKSSRPVQRLSSLARGVAGALPLHGGSASGAERRKLRMHKERKQILELRMSNAETYREWEAAAIALDKLEGNETWKTNDESDEYYNPDLITSRLHDLEHARIMGDIPRMMHLVRTALSRDVGGIGSSTLYNHSHVGTKKLVERYVKASVDIIQALVDRSAGQLPKGMTHRQILDSLLLARRSYGRSALVLSGGSVYGMAHIGVLKSLFEAKLLPRIISGTSAGSIVAAVVCTKTDEEIPAVLAKFAHGDLAVFTDRDNPDSWATHIMRALRYGTWHDSKHITRVMRDTLGDMTFQEAFNRTRRILNVTVSSKPGLQLPSLLNYLTAPNVIIWSAVVASCSVPGVFDGRPLLVRDEATGEHVPWDPAQQLWIDGSLDNDVPVERLGEMLNVNHFIVSQTNPHIVVFVSKDEKRVVGSDRCASSPTEQVKELIYTLGWLGKSELVFTLETLIETGIMRGSLSMAVKMLNQKYTADINILPRMSLMWGPYVIRNPTPQFMLEACRVGERATWPSLCRIEQSCAVELALDRAVHKMRETIAFSASQVNLRRLITGSTDLGIVVGGLKPHPKHNRRGSGGSIQLSARRRLNRDELETILSESDAGHDSDPESNVPSLAARRGMQSMIISPVLGEDGRLPPYRGPIKQNSLQQLPVAKSPSPSPSHTRKPGQGYGFFGGAVAPFTRIVDDHMPDTDEGGSGDDADEPAMLSMKLPKRGGPLRRQLSARAGTTPPRGTGDDSDETDESDNTDDSDTRPGTRQDNDFAAEPSPYDGPGFSDQTDGTSSEPRGDTTGDEDTQVETASLSSS